MSRGTFVPRAPSRPRLADEKPSTALVVRLLLIVLSATALGVSVFLAYMALSGKILPGCSNEGILNCDMVLSTKWSKWFNLPVALPAASLYAGLLGLLLFTFGYAPPEVRRMAWRVIAVLAASAALAGLWFIVLQAAVVKHWCPWCLAVHCSGVVLAVLVFALAPPARKLPLITGLAAFCCVGLLVGGQLISKTPETHTQETIQVVDLEDESPSDDANETANNSNDDETQPHVAGRPVIDDQPAVADMPPQLEPEDTSNESVEDTANAAASQDDTTQEFTTPVEPPEPETPQRMVTIARGLDPVDMYDMIVLGSPEAPYVVYELFDYTCSHCREMAPKIEALREHYGDDVAVVLFPVPLSAGCNRYVSHTSRDHVHACQIARYAFAVWLAAPEEFESYHEWLLESEDAPTQSEAQARASSIIGAPELLQLSRGEEVAARLSASVDLYGRLNRGTIPKLLIGDQVIQGRVSETETLLKIMEESLPVESASE